jgi:hypothetical protein
MIQPFDLAAGDKAAELGSICGPVRRLIVAISIRNFMASRLFTPSLNRGRRRHGTFVRRRVFFALKSP